MKLCNRGEVTTQGWISSMDSGRCFTTRCIAVFRWYATAFNMDVALLQSAFILKSVEVFCYNSCILKSTCNLAFRQEPAILKRVVIALFTTEKRLLTNQCHMYIFKTQK